MLSPSPRRVSCPSRIIRSIACCWCTGWRRSDDVRGLLKEIWRVLAGGGRVLIVAPNRRGIWARLDRTPFGSGRPYTLSQLSQLLRDEQFTPVASDHALFVPPSAGE